MVMATLTAGLPSGANATTRRRPAALEKRAWWAGRQHGGGQGSAGEQRQGVLRFTRDLPYQRLTCQMHLRGRNAKRKL